MNGVQLSSFNYRFDTNTGKCLNAQVGLHGQNTDSTEFVDASIRINPEDLPEGKTFMQMTMDSIVVLAKQKLASDTAVKEQTTPGQAQR